MPSTGEYFRSLIKEIKSGQPGGIFSVCSSHPSVIRSAVSFADREKIPLLIESTCNQVNQFGGYTGKKPADFSSGIQQLRADTSAGQEHEIFLGGDHLGPYPWRNLPADEAMRHAAALVGDYVSAGYRKIHLDTSMPCLDDNAPLDPDTSARRAAFLCGIAEQAAADDSDPCVYVIGSEVPTPGGAMEEIDSLPVTSLSSLKKTFSSTKEAFLKSGLESAWKRTIAIVVEPGVEFSAAAVHEYQPSKTRHLVNWIQAQPEQVFEAHSTDYQPLRALKSLLRDQFSILKVGPELTYAFREAVLSLWHIEKQLLPFHSEFTPSRIPSVLEEEMLKNPRHWENYLPGSIPEGRFSRLFSLHDRVRYYWDLEAVQISLQKLLHNLSMVEIPLALISQYLPIQYEKIRSNQLEPDPNRMIDDQIQSVFTRYRVAIQESSSS